MRTPTVAPTWTPARPASVGRALRRHAARVAGVVVAVSTLALLTSRGVGGGARDRRAALTAALAERGLTTAPADVHWIDAPAGALASAFCTRRAIVRASTGSGDPNDLYVVETRLSPAGVLVSVGDVYNVTETTGADESRPVVRGERVAYAARPLFAGAATTVHVLDFSGQAPPAADWSRLERAQSAISNWQQTGQLRGVKKRTFAIEPPEGEAEGGELDVTVGLEPDALVVEAGGREAVVNLAAGAPPPPSWVRSEAVERARPGNLVTWSVDRVRAIPWVGDDAMQSLKAVAFTALDFVLRHKESVTGDTGAEGIAADLGQSKLDPATRSAPVDTEIGWPPPPLETWVTPTLPGEGQWNSLEEDAFVRKNPGLPTAFVTTFVRSDRTRKATRVYIAVWDPRQVELHMMAGTVEPKSATGEAGPGLIPRTPEVMKRVVAASNAGFQALHGEFGMMADGVVYLPPKPYAATVAVLRDGTTAFGTWPLDPTIPDTIRSYRQNMTVMVEDEKFNPYGRTWWGGTVPGSEDKTHTVRTGICMTREQFVAYFYGADLSPDALSQAMILARCKYGIALDMNAGHSGMEFYKVGPAEEIGDLGRPLSHDWEAEGNVSGLEGWRFRGRRLIRGMGLMNFPRYIKRESRDYFYMTLRHALPGAAIEGLPGAQAEGEAGKAGHWRVKGVPQHGFPYAVALTELAAPTGLLRVLSVDPRTVTATTAASGEAPTVMVLDAGESGATSLWHSQAAFSIGPAPPVSGATRLASGQAQAATAAAAVGVSDEEGMLVYVEAVPPSAPTGDVRPAGSATVAPPPAGVDGKILEQVLAKLGCSTRLLLARPLSPALGGDTGLSGDAVRPASGPSAVRLTRAKAPAVARIFEDTPVVPFKVWYPLQQHRVRYFKKPETASDDE